MDRYVSIGEAWEVLGVSITTLRRWKAAEKLKSEHTAGGHHRYDLAKLRPELYQAALDANRKTLAHARVSSHGQKADWECHKQGLALYCPRQAWMFEGASDLGSGMNSHKKRLHRLLDTAGEGRIGRLVSTYKDRLLRFGAELVLGICEVKGVEVVLLNQGLDTTFEKSWPRRW